MVARTIRCVKLPSCKAATSGRAGSIALRAYFLFARPVVAALHRGGAALHGGLGQCPLIELVTLRERLRQRGAMRYHHQHRLLLLLKFQ